VASAIPPSFHHRSASLGSRSGSVPLSRSPSVASGSRAQSQVSSSIAPLASDSESTIGPSKLPKADKDLLLEYLGIDTELPELGPPGLRSAYQKFKAITNATPQVMDMGRDNEWNAQFGDSRPWVPTIVHFIDIFIAKSQFYQIWRPLFTRAQEYPDMKDWLNTHKDRLPTKELWNLASKRAPTFPDLKKWLDEQDRAADQQIHAVPDMKGKRKAPPSPPKLKKKKHDDRDRSVVQRKHKKVKIAPQAEEESE
jgi:hypothetical protein